MRKFGFILAILILPMLVTSAQEVKKHSATYYFDRGEESLNKKEYIAAHAHFNECLRLDPYYAEAYRLRGIAREHLGETAKALTDYNVYVDLKPNDAGAIYSRAVLRFDSKQYLPARQDFLKLLTMPTGETNMVYFSQEKFTDSNTKIFTAQGNGKDYIYNYLGVIETKLKRYDIAIGWLDSAVRVSPKNASYWINRGTAKLEKKDKTGATSDFEQALLLEPENSLALHNLATLKGAGGDTDAQEKFLTEAIEKDGNLPYPHSARGYLRLQKNDFKGALEDYDDAVRLDPGSEENYINRGLVKEKMKDMQGALDDYSKALEINDKNEKVWQSHGNIMSKLGKWNEAIEDYSVAITHKPEFASAYYNRAMAYQNAGKRNDACADIHAAENQGMKVDPKVKEKICK